MISLTAEYTTFYKLLSWKLEPNTDYVCFTLGTAQSQQRIVCVVYVSNPRLRSLSLSCTESEMFHSELLPTKGCGVSYPPYTAVKTVECFYHDVLVIVRHGTATPVERPRLHPGYESTTQISRMTRRHRRAAR